MQYHFDGFTPGDPLLKDAVAPRDRACVDVLIIGCGPAGLTLAAQLSQFADITTRIVDQKPGPLQIGQADGIACRSMEMFQAFGFADRVKREGYWVNETAFWRTGAGGVLERQGRIDDVEEGLSEMPHIILSQARVHDFFLDVMAQSAHRLVPDYNMGLTQVIRDDHADYPVLARFDNGEEIRTKYLIGCDGARSQVRRSMGLKLEGEAVRQLWGVMDVLAVTDFPDIRLKCAVQSAERGSVLIIPREGGTMLRSYIELDHLKAEERASDRNVTAEMLVDKAKAIFAPYRFDVKQVAWHSAYEIGQRVSRCFDDGQAAPESDPGPRIMIAGDACHTHSPKAGQGMNVSMADTFNLGWKLAAVLRGQSDRQVLETYHTERHAKAVELIEFDREMAQLIRAGEGQSSDAFQAYFLKHGRYTAGVETRYDAGLLVDEGSLQDLATGFVLGKRFHSAPVIRLADAKPMELAHAFEADGRWRIVVFAPKDDEGAGAGSAMCTQLMGSDGLIPRYTPEDSAPDSVIDLRAVYQAPHRSLALEAMPKALLPTKGRFDVLDYEKIFCPAKGEDIFDLRGIDRRAGAMVVVRPDQFVSGIYPLDDIAPVARFFARFMI